MTFLAYLSLLLILGMIAQWLAWRFKLPSILLLLIFGYGLAHVTGHKIDDFLADEGALLSLVGYFVAIILFEGGLTLKLNELKEAGTPVRRLCTVAVLIACVLTALAAGLIMGYPRSEE
ncbi:MAG: cation:proton antiporter, partial [Verrucomicrobiales bacterium]